MFDPETISAPVPVPTPADMEEDELEPLHPVPETVQTNVVAPGHVAV